MCLTGLQYLKSLREVTHQMRSGMVT